MRPFFRTALWVLAASTMGQAFAAEAAGTGRVLLQPPREVIASPISDRFAVRMLYYGPIVDNVVRYDNSAGVAGTQIDVEGVLGQADSDQQGTVDLMFRMGDRHRIQADFFQLKRHGDRVVNQPIRFGDDTYAANARLVSDTELRKLGVVYTYSFLRRERLELAAGLGIHLLQLTGTVARPATFESEDLDTAGPFASLVGSASWRLTRRFSVNLTGQYFDLKLGEVRGAFRGFSGDLQFRAWRNLAIGAGYAYSGYLVDSAEEDFAGMYRLVYQGPQAFFRVSF